MAEDYPVHVVRVIDGDSVKVRLPDGDEYSVRMYGIDAPEKDQRGGSESKDHLQHVVRSRREWRLRVIRTDRYQRLVGVLYPEGQPIRHSANHVMVETGHAYWYRQYGGGELGFDRSERRAKDNRVGVWGQRDAVRPWEHRRANRDNRKQHREVVGSPSLSLLVEILKLAFTLVFGVLQLLFAVLSGLIEVSGSTSTGRPVRRRRKRSPRLIPRRRRLIPRRRRRRLW